MTKFFQQSINELDTIIESFKFKTLIYTNCIIIFGIIIQYIATVIDFITIPNSYDHALYYNFNIIISTIALPFLLYYKLKLIKDKANYQKYYKRNILTIIIFLISFLAEMLFMSDGYGNNLTMLSLLTGIVIILSGILTNLKYTSIVYGILVLLTIFSLLKVGPNTIQYYYSPEIGSNYSSIETIDQYRKIGIAPTPYSSSVLVVLTLMTIIYVMSLLIINIFNRILKSVPVILSELKEESDVYTSLQIENTKLNVINETTKEIQKIALPFNTEKIVYRYTFNHLSFQAALIPSDVVGGDFYDVYRTDDGMIFWVGDVVGHGLQSCIIMSMIQTILNTLIKSNNFTNVKDLYDKANKIFYKECNRKFNERFVASLSIFQISNNIVTVVGQHESFFLKSKVINSVNAFRIDEFNTKDLGLPFGIVEDSTLHSNTRQLYLYPTDTLFIYTDGVTECRNKDNELLGIYKLKEFFRSANSINTLLELVKEWCGTNSFTDDVTLLYVRNAECQKPLGVQLQKHS